MKHVNIIFEKKKIIVWRKKKVKCYVLSIYVVFIILYIYIRCIKKILYIFVYL